MSQEMVLEGNNVYTSRRGMAERDKERVRLKANIYAEVHWYSIHGGQKHCTPHGTRISMEHGRRNM